MHHIYIFIHTMKNSCLTCPSTEVTAAASVALTIEKPPHNTCAVCA